MERTGPVWAPSVSCLGTGINNQGTGRLHHPDGVKWLRLELGLACEMHVVFVTAYAAQFDLPILHVAAHRIVEYLAECVRSI